MAGKKNTDLKIGTIRSKAKETQQKEKYELDTGETITFYPIFSDNKIADLYDDYKNLLQQSKDKKIELSDRMTYYLLLLQAIRHFTHLGKDMKSTIEYQLEFLDAIVDSGYFKIITEEVFLPDQVNKILDKASDILSADMALTDIMTKAQDKFEGLQIKNKDIFEQFANKQKSESESKVVN
jgi:hypothetical protein